MLLERFKVGLRTALGYSLILKCYCSADKFLLLPFHKFAQISCSVNQGKYTLSR